MSEELKQQGNKEFAAKNFEKAVELFTQAIQAAPEPNHVLFSNRSGAYASLKNYTSALQDAQECIQIKPDWPKGYSRQGAALHGLGDLVKAVEAYERCLELDPANAQAKSGLASVNAAVRAEAAQDGETPDLGMGKLFKDPATFAKLAANPKTRAYLDDPTFMAKLKEMAENPMAALSGGMDPRMMEAMGVILGFDTKQAQDTYRPEADDMAEVKEPEPEPQAEEPQASDAQSQALAEKQKGNAQYKQRQFDQAIEHYDKAYELFQDVTFLNNKSAALFEKGDLETAVAVCKEAIAQGHETRADYRVIAKAYSRLGSCYIKQDELALAIEAFERSLTEHRTPEVLTKLRSAQKAKRSREEQAYIDPGKADEARSQGNDHFKKGEFPESVKAYTESIKRAPSDPRGYGNRAAAFLKLMNYPDVVRDCDEAIKLDPAFFKAYTRKATALNIMKQYRKAMDTLDEARRRDTENKHTREIEELAARATQGRFAPLDGETEEQRAERLSQDPEIDEIRRDPVMNTILQQASTDPAALRDHMKNPEVRRKINLLAAAGVIRTR